MSLEPNRFLRAAVCAAALGLTGPALIAQCGLDPNFGASISMSDDSVSGALSLGFTVSFAGVSYDSVIVSSNGFVYLWDSLGSVPQPTLDRCCTGDVAQLLASTSPIIAGMWLDLNPSSGGSVHFNSLPGEVLITWSAVPTYPNNGANTFQIGIASSGVVELAYDLNVRNLGYVALTGMSPGAGAANPGGSDLSASPFVTNSATVYQLFPGNAFDLQGSAIQFNPLTATSWVVTPLPGCASTTTYGAGCPTGTPLTLNAQSGSRPALGGSFTLEVSRVRAGTLAGAVGFGFSNPALNLASIGLPACTLLSSVEVSLGITPTAPITPLTFPIPNFPSIAGASLNAQAVMIDPSLGGSLPAYLSNGVRMVFGN